MFAHGVVDRKGVTFMPDSQAFQGEPPAGGVQALLAALDTETDPKSRRATIEALGQLGDDGAVDALAKLLGGDDGYAAAEALATFGSPRALNTLFDCLNQPFAGMGARPTWKDGAAAAAASGLRKSDASEVFTRLGDTLADGSAPDFLRIRCAGVLAQTKRPEADICLLDALSKPGLAGVAIQGMETGRDYDERFVQPLIGLLSDRDWRVRGKAVSVLGQVGSPQVVEPLVRCLSDTTYDVRRRSILALAKLGDPRAVGPMRKAADKEPEMGGWMLGIIDGAFPDEPPPSSSGKHWWQFWN